MDGWMDVGDLLGPIKPCLSHGFYLLQSGDLHVVGWVRDQEHL